ncbi:hypothetical protein BESB_071680 [Besnoitia besnoiti]|uniref:RAP domain-containing protein n=1 Tax=Besnoitia besnoiti TaxID=94643 RepID=A0A2A9MDI7_BESBE|nr:uncharacterized protein BESB_071680 [Besnoitia besnoiti]PFH34016.1 hypothetical protein BESB_071680 [Besnoitia besnoiti]
MLFCQASACHAGARTALRARRRFHASFSSLSPASGDPVWRQLPGAPAGVSAVARLPAGGASVSATTAGAPESSPSHRRNPHETGGGAPAGAVSYETLAGIPWMSRGRLCSVVEAVTERGPYDVATWNKLLCRAAAISASLSAQDIGRLVVSMAKVKYFHPGLLRKLARLAQQRIEEADALACSGILYSYSSLNCYDPALFQAVCSRLKKREVMRGCQLFPLSLALSACVREKIVDEEFFLAAGERLSELLPGCKLSDHQSVALILNGLARLFNLQQQAKFSRAGAPAQDASGEDTPSAAASAAAQLDLKDLLWKISSSLPPLLPAMNLQSLTVVLNALSRLRSLCAVPPEVIALTCDALAPRAHKLTALQAVIVLNALAKLRLGGQTELVEAVLGQLRERAHHLPPQAVCLTIKALSALRLKDRRLEEELERQVCLTFHHFSTAEVAMLKAACWRWPHVPASLENFLNEESGEAPDAEAMSPEADRPPL